MPRSKPATLPLCALAFVVPAMAQAIPSAVNDRISTLESAVKTAQSAGDNAWMLVSAAAPKMSLVT